MGWIKSMSLCAASYAPLGLQDSSSALKALRKSSLQGEHECNGISRQVRGFGIYLEQDAHTLLSANHCKNSPFP